MTADEADPLVKATRAFREAEKTQGRAKARLTKAQEAHSAASKATAQRRDDLAKVIADQARNGRRNRDIRAVTGYTPERIRQICRHAGVESQE
jgi:hypothetical protein